MKLQRQVKNNRTTANYLTPAYQIYDANGQPLAQQNPSASYIAPLDYNVFNTIDTAKGMGQTLGLVGALYAYNTPNYGAGDIQHNYEDGAYGSNFVKAFTDIGIAQGRERCGAASLRA